MQMPIPLPPPAAGATAVSAVSQNMAPGVLNPPVLAISSPPAQFVLGNDTNKLLAEYSFSASGSPVNIQELDFTVVNVGSNVPLLPIPPVKMITVNGIATLFGAGTSTVTGLNITVPGDGSFVNVPVLANYQIVGSNNPANQAFTLNLVGVKYISGGATTSLAVNIPSNSMDLAASVPTVTLTGGGQTLTDNNVLFAKVGVSVNNYGDILLNQLPLVISSAGGAEVIATTSNMTVTDGFGSPVQVSYGSVGFAAGGSSSVTVTFNSGNEIKGNSPKTYCFYLPVQGALGTAGSSSIETLLGGAGQFEYTDLAGGGAAMTGATYISNYPTAAVSIHN